MQKALEISQLYAEIYVKKAYAMTYRRIIIDRGRPKHGTLPPVPLSKPTRPL